MGGILEGKGRRGILERRARRGVMKESEGEVY